MHPPDISIWCGNMVGDVTVTFIATSPPTQYFDTVGWVFLTCKNRIHDITYTVLAGT